MMCAGMQDVDHRLTHDVDRLCLDLAELIPNMVRNCTDADVWQHLVQYLGASACDVATGSMVTSRLHHLFRLELSMLT